MKNALCALCISAGGTVGAAGGGIIQYLIEDKKIEYDMFIGNSTGNILASLSPIKKIKKLKRAYTSISQRDIFKLNPFRIKKTKGGVTEWNINYLNVLYNIVVRRQKTFGDSSNLRKNLESVFTKNDYIEVLRSGKDLIVTVTNLTLNQVEYKSIKDFGYNDFLDYLYAGACLPPFMSLVEKDGYEYVDGGLKTYIPLQKAINMGATYIDAIMLRPEKVEPNVEKVRNSFHLISKIIETLVTKIRKDSVEIGELMAKEKEVTLNFYYIPKKLTNNPLLFEKSVMLEWWEETYEYIKNLDQPTKTIKIST